MATGLIAGTATAVARGGRVTAQQIAIDAMGNAVGASLAENVSGVSNPSSANYVNEMDRASDAYRPEFNYAHRNEMDRASDAYNPASAYGYRNGSDIQSDAYNPAFAKDYRNAMDIASDNFNPATLYGYKNGMDIASDQAYAARQRRERLAREAVGERTRELNRFASAAQLNRSEAGPVLSTPRTAQEAAALLASMPRETALERLQRGPRNNVDGPSLTAWDPAADKRAALELQRAKNNIAMYAGGPIVGGPMLAARDLGVDEFGVEQTGIQASSFMDLYAPRGPSGVSMLARVRGTGRIDPNYSARLGESTITSYRETFFRENPELRGEVWVHHAVERQAMDLYPGEMTASQAHSIENLRGIPKDVNAEVHLSKIRKEWNRFYLENSEATQADLLRKATEIDMKYGHLFTPPVGRKGQ